MTIAPDAFAGSGLKLDRAEEHIAHLHRYAIVFSRNKPYRVVADFEREPGLICWVARGEDIPNQERLAPVIGDAVHNMRDALDLAISAIYRAHRLSDGGASFITADSLDGLERAVEERAKKQKPVPEQVVRVLKARVKPYIGGSGHLLRSLHKLAIMDKHRLITPTIFGVQMIYFGINGSHVPVLLDKPVPIKNGAVLAQMSIEEVPGVQVNQEALVPLTIAFDKACGRLYGHEVVPILRGFHGAAKETLNALRDCLPG